MNVIISNKYQVMLQSLNIEVIKSMNGEFDVDEIISTFQNFYFQRMILDITALKDYKDIKTIQKLSISLDMNKVILLLDNTPESMSNSYLSKLISLGIYNFTTNADGILYLLEHPNSYRDVAHIHELDAPVATAAAPQPVSRDPNAGATYINVVNQATARIIGLKNVTRQSGATTLIFMIKKVLEKAYSTVAVEVNKRDFMYFNDKDFISTTNNEIGNTLSQNSGNDIILVDINDSAAAEHMCNEVIYLLEPSIIKLNKLMLVDAHALEKLKDKKVVLSQSLLSTKDVSDFEYESGIKVFFNMPPLNEREDNSVILSEFLRKLGFDQL